MAAPKEIPADTPEATVAAICAITEEEAGILGASVTHEEKAQLLGKETTINLTRGDRYLRIVLNWAESSNVPKASGTIGNGFVGYEWDLELVTGDPPSLVAKPAPPFRWGLYPRGTRRVDNPPDILLDGARLRRLIRDALRPN